MSNEIKMSDLLDMYMGELSEWIEDAQGKFEIITVEKLESIEEKDETITNQQKVIDELKMFIDTVKNQISGNIETEWMNELLSELGGE